VNDTLHVHPEANRDDNEDEWWSGSALISVDSTAEVTLELKEVVQPLICNILAEELKISRLFPIQAAVIPLLLQARSTGQSACVCAATGSGKTLCFVLPILQVHRATCVVVVVVVDGDVLSGV